MVLYNDKILLLLTPLTQIGIYLNPHINFLSSFFFFYMNGVSVQMKPMNPLTAKPHLFETALPKDCLQCIMGIA